MSKYIKVLQNEYNRSQSCILAAIIILLLFPVKLFSQSVIGVPEILNYTKQNYNAGTQNRVITQDKDGIIYFANSDGLLVYDGVHWDLFRLQNGTALLSIALDNKGRIFTGGQGEIGYFSPGNNGKLNYHSLNHLLSPKDNIFAEVWDISEYKGHVFFRTNNKILEYTGKSIIVHKGIYWSFLTKIGNRLLAYDSGKGLMELIDKSWNQILPRNTIKEVRSVIPLEQDSLLISTLENEVYLLDKHKLTPFPTTVARELKVNGISCQVRLTNGNIAFGTFNGGVYIINNRGALVQRITKNDGLQSDNVLSLKEDKDVNIWVGLDNGTDMICYGNAIKHIYPERESQNSGFASAAFNNILYLGTTTGLFNIPIGNQSDFTNIKGHFSVVANSQGQTWKLSQVYDKLLLAHSSGAFVIDGNTAKTFNKNIGYWGFLPFSNNANNFIIGGTYNGINLFNYKDALISSSYKNLQFESARFLVLYDDVIWIAHPYRGLFKVTPDHQQDQITVKQYEDRKKILSSNHNKIFGVNGKLFLITDKGFFEYDKKQKDFVKSVFLTKIFNQQRIDYLYEDRYGNIWFTGDKKIGVVSKSASYSKITYLHELENRFTANYENINVIDSNNVIIGAEKGFFHVNLNSYLNRKLNPTVLIRSVRTLVKGTDSLLYGGFGKLNKTFSIDYSNKEITINFAATEYRNLSNIEYSYLLKGFDKEWSGWNTKTGKEYSNLLPGTYTFYVKCRIGGRGVSEAATYTFVVLPAWYQTWWANGIYALVIVGLLLLLLKYQQRRYYRAQQTKLRKQRIKYEEEQRILEVEHRIEVQEKQREIIQLTNEKLQAELEHKNQELASSAMNLVRKMEVMSKLKGDLEKYKEVSDDEKSKKDFHKIIKVIDNEIEDKQEWERFATHFDTVHNNFIKNLKAHYPDITANELKLSAYLKLNISTKEIAQLMNLSIRGVETGRFRLRKKLSISGDTNLADFLLRFNDEVPNPNTDSV